MFNLDSFDDAASHPAARRPRCQGVRHAPHPQVILTLVYHDRPARDVHIAQEGRLGVAEGHLDFSTGISTNVAQVTNVALRRHRSSMIFLKEPLQFLSAQYIYQQSTHIIRVVMAPGPLAVVAEVPVLVDMEPVHHVGGEAAQVEAEHGGLRG